MPGKKGDKSAYNPVSIPDKYRYGDAAEIESRSEGTGAGSGLTAFKQLGPGDSGGDASNPSFKKLSSDIKFSSGTGS